MFLETVHLANIIVVSFNIIYFYNTDTLLSPQLTCTLTYFKSKVL
jgi:hypothetical protein